jgi:hypothetical protein
MKGSGQHRTRLFRSFAVDLGLVAVLHCPHPLIVVTVGGVLSMALRVLRMAFGHH